MPAKKTNFIPYACFGYYDNKFNECINCKHGKACNKASTSDNYEEIRKMYKFKTSQIKTLVDTWSK